MISGGLKASESPGRPRQIITQDEITEMLDRVERALADLTVQVRRERLTPV